MTISNREYTINMDATNETEKRSFVVVHQTQFAIVPPSFSHVIVWWGKLNLMTVFTQK